MCDVYQLTQAMGKWCTLKVLSCAEELSWIRIMVNFTNKCYAIRVANTE